MKICDINYERESSMKTILDLIVEELKPAFTGCGYDEKYIRVTVSNRPDLCEYQCNGAMAAAKAYKKKPIDIANEVVEKTAGSKMFSEINAVMPGFINIRLNPCYLASYVQQVAEDEKLGLNAAKKPETIIIDYGGANVAKPLHVGHLRSAVIGESIKRISRYMGHHVISDVHLGDWGLQMGLIIEELHDRQPDLVYFDPDYTGEYPSEPPFTISELEDIYPAASAKSKVDAAFRERAQQATFKLQSGYAPFHAIWKHIMNVSLKDLKKNYGNLNVSFDLWKGESDAQPYIPGLIEGASEGIGLGHEFLRHIERTKVIIHIVDAAGTEGRDPIQDIYAINKELEAYNPEIAARPQVIAANKIDAIYTEDGSDPVAAIRAEFEPKGIKVFPMSAVTGQGVKELLYEVNDMLANIGEETTVFAQEYFPESMTGSVDDAYTVTYDEEEDEYVVEGPKIEKMLGYTNLDSEKGFTFFQNFLKDTGILEELEALGIQEGDTVRMYGLSFDYYK